MNHASNLAGSDMDLLEAMSLTPWRLGLNNAIAAFSLNGVRSLKTIARQGSAHP